MFLMLTQNYCQLKAQWNKTDLHCILDFTECKLQALGKHLQTLFIWLTKSRVHFSLPEGILPFFYFTF